MKAVKFVLVSMAVLGLCVPSLALAVESLPQPVVTDVALDNGGTLQGQLVDLPGNNVAGVPVSMRTQDHHVATTTTLADGRFTVQGLKGGVYQVAAGEGQGVYRLWSPGTAPPSARNGAIVYTQNCRGGGCGGGGLKNFLANPLVIAAIVATAIAVPVALANSHDASP
jgi:hypothetical protein